MQVNPICEICEHYMRGKCGKCGCTVINKCPLGKWGNRFEAVGFMQSCRSLLPLFKEAADVYNVAIDSKDYREYNKFYRASKNIITWGVKFKPEYYNGDKNVMFIENGLLRQASGIYMDNMGWFSNSSIVQERKWMNPATGQDRKRLDAIIKSLGGSGSNPDGPIMLALQNERDAPVRFHFKHKVNETPMLSLIQHATVFKDREVIVRPHPLNKAGWLQIKDRAEKMFGSKWRVDESPDVYKTLRSCSGLITVNSTLATECVALGIKVAALGTGTFEGSGTVLECNEDPTTLAWWDAYKPNPDAAINYCGAVLRQQLPYQTNLQTILTSEIFTDWINKCK